jgi:hypothetical protein
VVLVRAEVSEKLSTSIIRARISELGTLALTNNYSTVQSDEGKQIFVIGSRINMTEQRIGARRQLEFNRESTLFLGG